LVNIPVSREHLISAFDQPEISADGAADIEAWLDGVPDDERPEKLKPAAVLMPLIDHPDGMTVLLTQRTAHLSAHAGQISFPGGRFEAGDGTPENTALRETEEEIGLARAHIEVLGRLAARETGTGYRVVPVVGVITPPFPVTPDPGEVAEVFEVPLSFVLDPANHRFETRIMSGVQRQFYSVPYGDYYIWGLTARLLVNLSQRLAR
jgi:8-oxo-dGTP pyrophosphatase MutT (NUDIX family)